MQPSTLEGDTNRAYRSERSQVKARPPDGTLEYGLGAGREDMSRLTTTTHAMQWSVTRNLLAGLAVCVGLAAEATNGGWVVPKFSDLTITTRQSFGASGSLRRVEVLSLRGARERRESRYDEQAGRAPTTRVTITQCDRRRTIDVNPETKLYGIVDFHQASTQSAIDPAVPAQPADVTITFDAVDTGERRQLGRYVARRVRTTVSIEPEVGARTSASTRTVDGWYIDVPGIGCSSASGTAYLVLVGGDRPAYKTRGSARRGVAIDETTVTTTATGSEVSRIELVEFSEAPLDASLFDIPRGYRRALPLIGGGHDLTREDTLANRVQMYWNDLAWRARRLLG
jgi:hypothetical protein